jgi:hypothetical protein
MATAPTEQQGAAVPVATPQFDEVVAATEQRRSIAREAAALLGVSPDKLCGLLRNVWTTSKGQPDLTDQEMFSGISLVARYRLDPITREIYVTKTQGRLITVIGIDGWIKILDRTDHYDGFEVDIHHDEKGRLEWVETTIYSKTRSKPTSYRAYWSEYEKVGGFVSKNMPSHMLRIFSLRHAARLFVPLGATVVTEEEAQYLMQPQDAPGQPSSLDELTERLMQPVEKPDVTSAEPGEGIVENCEASPDPKAKPKDAVAEDSEQALHDATTRAMNELEVCETLQDVGKAIKDLKGLIDREDWLERLEAMGESRREQIRAQRKK